MRKSYSITVVIIISLLWHSFSLASEEEFDKVYREIDRLDDFIRHNLNSIQKELEEVSTDITKHTKNIASLNENEKEFDKKYTEIIKIESDFKAFQEKWTEYLQFTRELAVKLDSIKDDISNLRNETRVSKNIVSWVTLIVSVVIVLIGLFFSGVFLHHHGKITAIYAEKEVYKKLAEGFKNKKGTS